MDKQEAQLLANEPQQPRRYQQAATGSRLNVAGKKYHFIGAGGVGMSGLAKVLVKHGGVVKGSDTSRTAAVEQLRRLGANIEIGHSFENLDPDTDTVVVSAAIKHDNPELVAARQQGCAVSKYAQMLGELMEGYDGIAIAGTHGKSSTGAWLSYVLRQAGLEPSFIIGAEIPQLGGSSGTGDGDFFVAEACEYDRSFLHLKPKIGVVLNIEADHLDYYTDIGEIIEAFEQFARGIKPDGILLANGDDSNVARVLERLPEAQRCESFGFSENCNFRAVDIRVVDGFYCFNISYNGELIGNCRIFLPGRHNVLNALAVVAVAVNAGLPKAHISTLLETFTGVERRLMFKGSFNDITVLDDYAHHPTEIKASLGAIRERYGCSQLWCVFQPHQHSRTRFLLDDFAESFKLADITIVPEIYFVRDSQAAKKQINSKMLVQRLRDKGAEALFIDDFAAICDYLESNVKSGQLVVIMGAGDVWKIGDEYIQRIRENR